MTQATEAAKMFQNAVNGLAARPSFMAHVLFAAFAGDVSAKRISTELGCSEMNALRLAMMRAPRSERLFFRDDVSRIADATGVDHDRLLSVIQQTRALAVFDPEGQGEGMLIAARDVVPEPGERGD
jgi:hypothetical protein